MLLLVAYPAYTDYHARGKTSEVLAALMPARAALVRQIGSLPADADLRTLALPAPDSPWLVTARPLVLTQPTTSRVRLAARLSGIHPLEQRFWPGKASWTAGGTASAGSASPMPTARHGGIARDLPPCGRDLSAASCGTPAGAGTGTLRPRPGDQAGTRSSGMNT